MKMNKKLYLILGVIILLAIIATSFFVSKRNQVINSQEDFGNQITSGDEESENTNDNEVNIESGEIDITAVKQEDGTIAVNINTPSGLEDEEKEKIINNKFNKTEFMVTTTNEKPSIDDANWKEYVVGEKYILPEQNENVENVYVWYKNGNEVELIINESISKLANNLSKIKVGDYVNYKELIDGSSTYTTNSKSEGNTGYSGGIKLTRETTDWRVLSIDEEKGEILITTNGIVNDGTFLRGAKGYFEGAKELDNICEALYSSNKLGVTARSMTIEDLNKACGYTPAEPTDQYRYAFYPYSSGSKSGTSTYNGKTYNRVRHFNKNYTSGRFLTSEIDGGGGNGGTEDGYEYVEAISTSPVYITQTLYNYNPSSRNSTVGSILGSDWGWLASPGIFVGSNSGGTYNVSFGLRRTYSSSIYVDGMYSSYDGVCGYANGVRPVVSLSSNILIDTSDSTKDGSTPAKAWEIKANSCILMERDSEYISGTGTVYYAIGAYRENHKDYTADKIKTITLQNTLTAPANFITSWDASRDKDGSVMAWVVQNSSDNTMYDLYIGGNGTIYAPEICSGLFESYVKCISIEGLEFLDVSNVTNLASMFYRCSSLTSIGDLSGWQTGSVTNMALMFDSCRSLTSLDLSDWNTEKVTIMSFMFYFCNSLTSIGDLSGWQTGSVTDMSCMFAWCEELTSLDLSGWQTGSVRSMYSMFEKCYKLKSIGDLSGWSTEKVTDMSSMFSDCNNLTDIGELGNWQTGSVTNMSSMFLNCSDLTSLNLSGWSTEKVTDMSSMFSGCNNLTDIGDLSNWDTGLVTDMSYMFYHCRSLTNIGNLNDWKTGSVTDMSCMFTWCEKLTSLDLSGWQTGSVKSMKSMFEGCSKLKVILLGNNFDRIVSSSSDSFINYLTAIITPRTTAMSFDTTTTTSDAILYVPNLAAETTFEAAENATKVFSEDRIRPILELIGDSTVNVTAGETYTDAGATVAGFKEAEKTYYEQYGYSLSSSGVVNTSEPGTYTITYTLKKDNETVMSVTRKVIVSKLKGNITLSEASASVPYGTASHKFSVKESHGGTITAVESPDTAAEVSVSPNGEITIGNIESIAAGTVIKVTVTSSETVKYFSASAEYTLTITRANIAVPTVADRPYTGLAQTAVAASVQYTITGENSETDAGTYKVQVTPTSNYQWEGGSTTAKEITWKILEKEIAVEWTERSFVYNGSAQIAKVKTPMEGVNGEKVNITVSGAKINVGTGYKATASIQSVTNGQAKNYKLTNAETTFEITRANITVPTVADRTYTGLEQTGVVESVQYTITGENSATDAGTYKVQVTPTGNYQWEGGSTTAKEITWKILEKEIKVEWTERSFVYNGSEQVAKVKTPMDGVNGEKVNITVSGAKTDVGTGYPATASIQSVTNGQAKNYKLTNTETIFDITRANGSVIVAITGAMQVNKPLTVTVNTESDGDITYQWWWATDAGATSGTPITNATGESYTPTEEMSGRYVGVTVYVAQGTNYNSCSGYSKVLIAVANYKDNASPVNYYTTLREAFTKTADVAKITVLNDTTEVESTIITLEANKNIILDLNGRTITLTVQNTDDILWGEINNEGILTLEGTGKITTSENNRNIATLIRTENGTLTVGKDVTIEHKGMVNYSDTYYTLSFSGDYTADIYGNIIARALENQKTTGVTPISNNGSGNLNIIGATVLADVSNESRGNAIIIAALSENIEGTINIKDNSNIKCSSGDAIDSYAEGGYNKYKVNIENSIIEGTSCGINTDWNGQIEIVIKEGAEIKSQGNAVGVYGNNNLKVVGGKIEGGNCGIENDVNEGNTGKVEIIDGEIIGNNGGIFGWGTGRTCNNRTARWWS